MFKNWFPATGWAILLWLLLFIEISVVMFGLNWSETAERIIWLILEIPLIGYCAFSYLKKYPNTFKDGIFLGIWFIIIGTVLDVIITIPIFVKSYSIFYSMWSLYAGFILTLAVPALAAKYLFKK